VRYPEHLPVVARREELLATIGAHQVVIVAGETGSGKSTQLPKLCLELGRGAEGRMIAHTQPRRIAARAVAERVAEELDERVGETVGYTVRFTDRVTAGTRVRVMTDGILLAELQRDRSLERYDTIIVDEAHERSLNIDFILGYLKQLLPRRPDLKVIVTSATIDTARFAEHFDGAPVIEVSGRTFPVEVRYRPIDDDSDQTQAICDAVGELAGEAPGDVLVFLSGEREIRDTADALARMELRDTELLPLYARLSAEEQHRVFAPHAGRRVVLATNVAETSITVPGIRYVVDPGTARISRFNRRTKVQRLPIEPVSQASANQRAGRCGRVAPGVCIRLYDEDDFEDRPEFTDPEILRTNLASVILQMAALGLGDVAAFPFVEPPDHRAIADGMALLEELGAFEADGRLSAIGRRLARLPIDPRLGRMVLEAERLGCLDDVMVIAAALSIQDPRERPKDKEQQAAEAHNRFRDPQSDFLSYLALWEHLRSERDARSSSGFRRMCKSEFLNHLRVREWQDLHVQLRQVGRSVGLKGRRRSGEVDRDAIHRSLLAGLLSHVGLRDPERRDYLGARNARFAIAGRSALARKGPKWVMVAELVETNRLWGRVAAPIRPEWAEQLGDHLLRFSYGEPWWDERRGQAVTEERATLYGLPVVSGRRVPYDRVDPGVAREMFLRHALVEGGLVTPHPFVAENERRVTQVRGLEERVRRRGLLVDDDELVRFFDDRVPADITSGARFDRWWRSARRRQPDLLTYAFEDLVDPRAGAVRFADFPDTWGDLSLAYRFEPGHEIDGVTVDVPLARLDDLDPAPFAWHVPGRRPELVAALLRSAPKPVRRRLDAVADEAAAFLAEHGPDDGPLLPALARWVSRRAGEPVTARSWDLDHLPDHLRITFRALDERGRPLAWSKDLAALAAHLRRDRRAAVARATAHLERTGLTDWPGGELPRTVAASVGGHDVVAHPSLVAEGDTVAVRVLATEDEQRRAMWVGTRRLLLLTVGSPVRDMQRRLRNVTKLALARSPYATVPELLADAITAALDELLADHGGPAWDEDGFRRLEAAARAELVDRAVATASAAGEVVAGAADLEDRITALTSPLLHDALTDLHTQVARLVHRGFLVTTGARRLPDLRRYLDAARHRLDKLAGDVRRDRELMARVQDVEHAYERLRALRPDADVASIRWLLEELRVSLFAQHLGTAQPVSEQRVRREIERVA
jgi:ATP-dependent helicase HrpA